MRFKSNAQRKAVMMKLNSSRIPNQRFNTFLETNKKEAYKEMKNQKLQPYVFQNGNKISIQYLDGRYYLFYDYNDGSSLQSRHSYSSIQDAEKRRNEIIEEDIYDRTIECSPNKYKYIFNDKGSISVSANNKDEAKNKILHIMYK